MVYKQYNFYTNNAVDPINASFAIRGSPYVDRFKIVSVSVPLAYPTTDSSNNVVVFERSGSIKNATIPTGSYNAATFPTILQQAMNDVSAVKDYVVSYNETTRSLSITAGGSFTIHPFSRGTTAYRQLGMTKFSNGSAGTTVTFSNVDFTNYTPLLLTSNTLVSKDATFVNEENVNVLAMLDTDAAPNTVARWENFGSWLFCGAEMPKVDFRILNAATLLPVELSQPYSVTLAILTDPDDPVVA